MTKHTKGRTPPAPSTQVREGDGMGTYRFAAQLVAILEVDATNVAAARQAAAAHALALDGRALADGITLAIGGTFVMADLPEGELPDPKSIFLGM